MTSTVICGDLLVELPKIPDKSVDAIVTDPPYNVGFKYASTNDNKPDYEGWCRSWLGECERVCNGGICISCGTVNLPMWFRIKEPRWVICWHKPACMGNSPVGASNWEPVLLYGKPRTRKDCDFFRAPIKTSERLSAHPCPKPLLWGVKLVNMMVTEGMTVLDPFCGSGTVGMACVRRKCNFIGIDVEPDYVELTKSRIKSERRQPIF